jgi:TATA-binding protein-associated factor
MDRAHRLGQTKVVNVYRLITKGTLEEKIMGYVCSPLFALGRLTTGFSLQRFKLNIAHSVVTQQNAGLDTMDTNLILDLFKHTTEEEAVAAEWRKKESDRPLSQKELLAGLEDLPAEDEYQGLDLGSFLGSIGR